MSVAVLETAHAGGAPVLAPTRLRAMPVPDTEPAPDDGPYPVRPADQEGLRQPALVLGRPPTPDRRRRDAEAAISPPDGLPEPTAWTRRMAQAVAEVLCGVRPVGQLARWTNRDVYEVLRRGQPGPAERSLRGGLGQRSTVRSVRICQPSATVVEAAAVVLTRGRVRAFALRLEASRDRWRLTALELG